MPRLLPLILLALSVCALALPRPSLALLRQGQRPPAFALPDAQGRLVRLSLFVGRRRIALLFVPAKPMPSEVAFLRAVRQHRAACVARDLVALTIAPPAAQICAAGGGRAF